MHSLFLYVVVLLNFSQAYCGDSSSGSVCQNLCKTDRLVQDDYCAQPLYLSLAVNDSRFAGLDNVCYILTPLKTKEYFIGYSTYTYSNGTKTTNTLLFHQISPGYFSISSTTFIQNHAKAGVACGTMLEYVCDEFGETANFPNGITTKYGELSEYCVEQIKYLLTAQNLSTDNLFVLPMKLPPDCPVVPTNPFYKSGRRCCSRCNL